LAASHRRPYHAYCARRAYRPRGYDGSVVIGIGFEPSALAPLCGSVVLAARYGTSPYVMPYERNRPIVICRNMRPSLAARWSEFKRYGIEYWPQSTLLRRVTRQNG
jgi:hypothetical protein